MKPKIFLFKSHLSNLIEDKILCLIFCQQFEDNVTYFYIFVLFALEKSIPILLFTLITCSLNQSDLSSLNICSDLLFSLVFDKMSSCSLTFVLVLG
jgi:hypothetical protein